MADKFKDPIDSEADMAEGTRRSMEQFKAGLDSEEVVEVAEREEPGEDPDAELDAEPGEARPNKKTRRRERGANYRTMAEQRAAAEARAQALEEELQRTRAERQMPPAQQQQVENAAEKQIEGELDKVYAEQAKVFEEYTRRANAYAAAKREMPAEEVRGWEKKANDLDKQKMLLGHRLHEAREAPRRAQEEYSRMYRAKAPDVFGNDAAAAYAAAVYNQKKIENPRADQDELFEVAMEAARRVVLGKRPPPDAAMRQRATGMSRGVGSKAAEGPVSIQMTPAMRKIAIASYPKLTPDQAVQRWVNRNGRQFLEMEREQGRR